MAFGSGSDDGTCRLFDIRADRELMQYKPAAEKVVTSLSFSLSGRYLFTSYDDPIIRVWDTLKGDPAGDLKGHNQRVSTVGISSDGCALASGSWDNSIKVIIYIFCYILRNNNSNCCFFRFGPRMFLYFILYKF